MSVVKVRGATPLHHFTLTKSVVDAATLVDTRHTVDDMIDCDVWKFPFNPLEFTFVDTDFTANPNWFKITYDNSDEEPVTITTAIKEAPPAPRIQNDGFKWNAQMYIDNDVEMRWPTGEMLLLKLDQMPIDDARTLMDLIGMAATLLVCTVNTTNVVRQTAVNHRAARGVGKSKFRGPNHTIYLSTTRLTAPAIISGAGAPVRPHMRRGHIHTYHVGKGRTDIIKKFIQPIFVHADQMTVPVSQRYQVCP